MGAGVVELLPGCDAVTGIGRGDVGNAGYETRGSGVKAKRLGREARGKAQQLRERQAVERIATRDGPAADSFLRSVREIQIILFPPAAK